MLDAVETFRSALRFNNKPYSRGTYTETVHKGRWQPGAQKERGTLRRLSLTRCQHHTLMLYILSCPKKKKDAELGTLTLPSLGCKLTNMWELLPKLSLIRGDRTALQLMGGYWKLAPTDARGVRGVLTRDGWANSGPGSTRRAHIPKSKSTSEILTHAGNLYKYIFMFYVQMCGMSESYNLCCSWGV